MTQDLARAVVERYAASAAAAATGAPDAKADEAAAWNRMTRAAGRLGAARVRDSARRTWLVEPHRDDRRGRFVVVRPVRGDNEPFRASADGFRPEAYLAVSETEWALLALLALDRDGDGDGDGDDGRDDDELRHAGFRLVDRMVIDAQHRLLMGAAEDEDEDA
jgi:hypothetical protein